MPAPYTAFVALRDDVAGTGGVWLSTNFTISGTQPTWTKINTGLANTDVRVFRTDPFLPLQRQYLQLGNANQEIYRRNTAVSGNWVKIMDLPTAKTLIGDFWPAPNEANTSLEWIAPDPAVQGRIRCLLSNHSISPQNHDTYVMRSDDYGDTWTWQAMQFGGLTHFPTRGAKVVEGRGSNVWVAINHPLVPTMRVMYSSDGGASWIDSGQIGTGTVGYYQLELDPADATKCYLSRFSTTATSRDLIKLSASGGVITVTVLQDTLDLGSSYTHKTYIQPPIDHLWIDPTNSNHQRIQSAGKLYVTTDGWATVVNGAPATLTPVTTPANLSDMRSPNDDQTPIVMLHYTHSHGVVQSLVDESDTSLENRSGTNWNTPPYTDAVPSNAGQAAYWGLWIGTVSTAGIYVYAVEMGNVGTKHGIPLHGDRSAWDVDGFPPEHASDIAAATPHYHAPFPGAAGQVPVSNGSIWQSRLLSIGDIIDPTCVGQVLFTTDGVAFAAWLPVTDSAAGWLVDGATGYMIVTNC